MIDTKESVEIYAREINEETTLALFLKARMYVCDYQPGSRLAEAHYFAPHFGQAIARDYPGVLVGVSYIAKLEHVEVVESWGELTEAARETRGKPWFNTNKHFMLPLRGWGWKDAKRYVLFVKTPRLVFNPPVLKKNLVTGSGWLAKRFFSFDELFAAWGR